MRNANFFERGMDIIPLLNEQDVNSQTTPDWVKLRDYQRALVCVAKYGTEDVDTMGVQIIQATDASGTGSKKVDALFPWWLKQGTLTSQTVWTAGRLTTADDILGIGSAAPSGGTLIAATDVNTDAFILCIDVQVTDLDADNGFDWLSIDLPPGEVNNALLISAWVILMDARFRQNVPLSAIS